MEQDRIDLLFVDDDAELRELLVKRFQQRGHCVEGAALGEQALELLQRREFDVAVLDMMLPDTTGIDLLQRIKAGNSECEVLILTGQATVETAVASMKAGAFDYLVKPFPLRDLEALIEKAYLHRQLAKENQQLKAILARGTPAPRMVGNSPAIQEVFRLVERAGPSDKAILIQGESGTGKELVAQALHASSHRANKPMVVINCAALPESLLESELFGHEKGSFTGAVSAKQGLFEVADGGTLFIDEIGEMPGPLQAKLLRVLENGSMRRIGSIKERRVDVRILAATNRNMSQEVAAGRFREDLYYRINVMSLELPPLRKRMGDVPLLIEHFLGPGWEIDPAAIKQMQVYHWPGNVRQLINVIDRAKIMANDYVIRLQDLPREVIEAVPLDSTSRPVERVPDDLDSLQRSKIVDVLKRVAGNKSHAAKTLGIERRKLYRLLEKFQIQDAEYGNASEHV
ncbi:MAG: sigma-54-dependent transcriptional regulator [Planctomycetaceae bacterium]